MSKVTTPVKQKAEIIEVVCGKPSENSDTLSEESDVFAPRTEIVHEMSSEFEQEDYYAGGYRHDFHTQPKLTPSNDGDN